uniref:Uncharacterized protein n=1 Tax=Aegilops tauschii subsp. strangulata TaxID=200361 RepID=A0A453KKA7_AEGTS
MIIYKVKGRSILLLFFLLAGRSPSADQEFLILCGIYGVFVFGLLFLLSLCSHGKNKLIEALPFT